jgi:general secretion pathway protein B
MSLILDALKKSEAERQRQSGPTLLEVRVTRPRRIYPTWVIAVGALLALNMLLLLAFVLLQPTTPPPQGPHAAAATTAPTAVAPSSPAPAAAPAATASSPSADMALTAAAAAPSTSGSDAIMLPVPRTFSQPEPAGDGQLRVRNPADDEPAVAAAGGGVRPERDPAGRYAELPSFSEVSGELPDLRLDLHVYAERARDRYALINMHRVQEGDTLPEGPRVLAITRQGVALDFLGQQFMLRPQ